MYVNKSMILELEYIVAARAENARKHPSKANARALDAARAELREVCASLEGGAR